MVTSFHVLICCLCWNVSKCLFSPHFLIGLFTFPLLHFELFVYSQWILCPLWKYFPPVACLSSFSESFTEQNILILMRSSLVIFFSFMGCAFCVMSKLFPQPKTLKILFSSKMFIVSHFIFKYMIHFTVD